VVGNAVTLIRNQRKTDHTDRLFRTAYALCGSRAGAQELVEETFARSLERRRLACRRGELGYLVRVLRDTWVDLARAASTLPAGTGPAGELEWVVDAGGDPAALVRDVRLAYDAVSELPPPLREALVAVDVVGLCHHNAARALRIRQGILIGPVVRGRERIAAAPDGAHAHANDEQDEPAAAGDAVRVRDPSEVSTPCATAAALKAGWNRDDQKEGSR
jgi:RNA polymerase sigma-70 factor, ECF subfamily